MHGKLRRLWPLRLALILCIVFWVLLWGWAGWLIALSVCAAFALVLWRAASNAVQDPEEAE